MCHPSKMLSFHAHVLISERWAKSHVQAVGHFPLALGHSQPQLLGSRNIIHP